MKLNPPTRLPFAELKAFVSQIRIIGNDPSSDIKARAGFNRYIYMISNPSYIGNVDVFRDQAQYLYIM